MTTPSEVTKGVDFNSLIPGSLIDLETKSRHYKIECLGGNAVRISGHPQICPSPMPGALQGSVSRDGDMETGFIRPGKRLMFLLDEQGPVTTSRVLSVHVDRPENPHSVH